MKKIDQKYIEIRLKKLRETAQELKKEFNKTKNPILEDLYLEIQCYSDEIEGRLKIIERRKKTHGKKR